MDDYDFGIPAASRYAGERLGVDFTTPYALESIGVPFGRGNISVNNPLANPNMFSGVRSLEDLTYTLDPSLSIEAQNLAGISGLRARMDYDLFGGPTFGVTYQKSFDNLFGPRRPDPRIKSFITDYTNPFGSIGSFAESMASADTYGGGFNDSGGPDSSDTGYDSDDSGYGGGVTGGSFGE